MNRAPSPKDFWWEEHRLSCGGSYTKIKSPPPKPKAEKKKGVGQRKKNLKAKERSEIEEDFDIRSFFKKEQ
jgi:hypothetical protein